MENTVIPVPESFPSTPPVGKRLPEATWVWAIEGVPTEEEATRDIWSCIYTPEGTDCWAWCGPIKAHIHLTRLLEPHNVIWDILFKPPRPVRHKTCHTISCVNPEHNFPSAFPEETARRKRLEENKRFESAEIIWRDPPKPKPKKPRKPSPGSHHKLKRKLPILPE